MRWFHAAKRNFLTGLIVLVPAWGTFLILQTLFFALDGLITNLLGTTVTADIPGLGLLVLICLIFLSGVIATQFMGQRILKWTEATLERIPIVSSVYLTLKSMTDVFNYRTRFGQSTVVVFPFPRHGLWAVGFYMGMAHPVLQGPTGAQLAMVFVPTALHPFTGYLAFIPQARLLPINLAPEDAMKMEFSAGLYRPNSEWLKKAPNPQALGRPKI